MRVVDTSKTFYEIKNNYNESVFVLFCSQKFHKKTYQKEWLDGKNLFFRTILFYINVFFPI